VIIGVGTDLIEISRVQRALDRWGERFARKVLVDHELERFTRHRKPAHYLAKRFAAKEAFSKAMGTGIHHPVNWQNIGVTNLPSGRPVLCFSPPLAALLELRGVVGVHISLTDERDMAAATVILEGKSHGA
jgi:holo-[acyl-carrier protein] synthase